MLAGRLLAQGRKRGRRVGANPWQGGTLEWSAPSPPPPYNFTYVPAVEQRYPLWTSAAPPPGTALGTDQPRVRSHAQPLGPRHAAVVHQRLLARGLGPGAHERMAANLQPVGRREEHHTHRIAGNGLGNRAGVYHQRIHPAPARGNGAGEPNGPGAHDECGFGGGHDEKLATGYSIQSPRQQ